MTELKQLLSDSFDQEIIDSIPEEEWINLDNLCADPATGNLLRENILGYKSIISSNSHTLKSYIQAMRFCTLVLSGASDTDAFQAVFPNRYTSLAQKSRANVGSGVRAYKRTKLVQDILAQTRIPFWILYQDMRHDSLKTLHELMIDPDVHSRDRVAAANSLATQLAPPKEALHRVEVSSDKAMSQIDQVLGKLAEISNQQRNEIIIGEVTLKELSSE